MTRQRQEDCFAVTAPGLEDLCAAELDALGAEGIAVERGGVAFRGDRRMVYRANLWLRTASRVLVRVGTFVCRDFPVLYQKAVRLPWGRFLRPEALLKVHASSHRSRLIHTGRIEETVQQAVLQALGQVPQSKERRQQNLYVRLDHDHCTLSVDSSGELLHRRGYRREQGVAPLRETLAAAMLQMARWQPEQPLWDPFCGSGTLLVEAALWARGIPPGRGRKFAFMEWPKYYPHHWQALLDEFPEERHPMAGLWGSDRDETVLAKARRNAEQAGVADLCHWAHRPVGPWPDLPPGPGLILSNPPYGRRLEDEATVVDLLQKLKELLQGPCAGWRAVLLLPDAELLKKAGMDGTPLAFLTNGGLKVQLLEVR